MYILFFQTRYLDWTFIYTDVPQWVLHRKTFHTAERFDVFKSRLVPTNKYALILCIQF